MPQYKNSTGEKPTKIAEYMQSDGYAEEKDFLALARERFKLAVEAESEWRNAALDDLRFLTGDQWPQATKQARDQSNRPCLTINKLPSLKKQLLNELKARRPSIVVHPVGNGADVDGAEMLQGLLRHIEVQSDVEIADDNAADHMIAHGKGYVEICNDYIQGETFDQELYIKPIKNPFTIYCDPSSVLPDESDANWKFKVCDYKKSEFREMFPGSELASLADFMSIGDTFPQWAGKDYIRVAKYYRKEWKDTELYKLANGEVVTKENYDIRHNGVSKDRHIEIIDKRPYRSCTIAWTLMDAIERLDDSVFPGKVGFIPLIPCIAEDFDVNGVRYLAGFIRDAKDPQRSINYFRSYAAETIALAPKAPWVGWKGQFKDEKWKLANSVNYAYLEADVITTEGQPAPSLPQRNTFEPPIQAVLNLSMVIDGDLKAVTNLFEPAIGQPKGDQSGKAIDKLQGQSNIGNYNYQDNVSRMKRHQGRVLLDAAPFIYDAPRIQRIINPDGSSDMVILHSGREQAANGIKTDEVQDVYDLSKGVYDATVDVGPSYPTRRLQAFEQLSEIAAADKTGEVFKSSADLIISMSDAPEAKLIANRLKKMMPPDLVNDDPGDPKQALSQAQATVKQLQAQNQELMKQNAEFIDTIKTEQIQRETKLEQTRIQAAAQVEVAGLNAKLEQAKLDFAKFELIHTTAHEAGLAASTAATQGEGEGDGSDQGGEATPPPQANGGAGAQVGA